MKLEIPPAIVDPCPLKWQGMKGDDKHRFCEHCQLHVHNLSQMNARERRTLLTSDKELCVTYAVDEKGLLIETARRHWLLGFFSHIRATTLALAAAFLPLGTSCANRLIMGKPAPPMPSPTPGPQPSPSPRGAVLRGEIAPAPTPSATPGLAVPGGIKLPPPDPSPASTADAGSNHGR
jgi:hypothetical protein